LYRRYRPESFAEVVGQEHVTGPLSQALRNDRVHHAYLFSGPRGCGKTTSARILARCLNCELGPTPEPCGKCQSCLDLGHGGGGSIDVIEIDAASHGGVDDARELRDKAFFSPAGSRFKIYIIDEAHMVTKAGFNALLKLVEEPPAHLKFIFATTDPDAVISTIKSRTHHYPFRLVAPSTLQTLLASISEQEGVVVEPAVLPLVVRAGAGSARDALSILDQLIAGAGSEGVTYAMATALLGFTPAALLDEVVEAFGVGDAATVFDVVDRVVESGQDPRRFATDLLERLRDLVIVDAVPDAFARQIIGDVPRDQQERMSAQATRLGRIELTRAADIVNTGLTEMRGATAPRLQLEIICAKVLLPGASDDEASLASRLERVERRLSVATSPTTTTSSPEPSRAEPSASVESAAPTAAAVDADVLEGASSTQSAPVQATPDQAAPDQAAAGPEGLDLREVRRLWPEVLDRVKNYRRSVWMMLFEKSQVASIDDGRLTLAISDVGTVKAFSAGGRDEIVRQALIDVLGLDVIIDVVHDPGTSVAGPVVRETTAPSPARTASGEAKAGGASTAQRAPRAAAAPDSSSTPNGGTDDEASSDSDADLDDVQGHDLVAQQLGGKVIGEIEHH
jgi:DNA polymerase-3 subunit gamma/tau